MNPAVSVQELSAGYAQTTVLHQVTFSVDQGGFFVIIGPNGSGKTTLLKTITRLMPSQTGNVALFGRPLDSYRRRELARFAAFVPQSAPERSPYRVEDMVLMGRSPHLGFLGLTGKKDRDIAQKAMEFVEVLGLKTHLLDELSAGEKQRVLIARALCQQPRILFLDEPTANLDLAHQTRIMDLLRDHCRNMGTTVVMISHDVNLAAMYGDRLLLLKDGQVVKAGLSSEVLTYSTLEQAYGCVLLVDQSPLGTFPRVTPVPTRYLDPALKAQARINSLRG